ncbi:MAG: chemotaxis protein CheW [Myxococcota bacterium]|nr:chemotaxis protein CheW [Myxococcota bacterium]
MALDMAKYRALFLDEATEYLAEISSALIELEKDPTAVESIDLVFRMAHSIKSMAASVGHEAIANVAHALEDRMESVRSAGRLAGDDGLSELFRSLESLERMLAAVRAGDRPVVDSKPALVASLRAVARSGDSSRKKSPELEPPGPGEARRDGELARDAELALPPKLTSVRVSTESLDRFLGAVGEVILSTNQLRTAATGLAANADLAAGFDRVERRVGELQRRVLDLRTTPLQRVMDAMPRAARQLAEATGKRVDVEIRGAELELDRSILDRLSDPLLHLVRNAIDHGLETPDVRLAAGKDPVGRLVIEARREKESIRIEVRDDGVGVDLERVRARAVETGLLHPDLAEDLPPDEIAEFVFRPGLSTASAVSGISGRGVGMDAVRARIESLGGFVELRTEKGAGTATTLGVPITAAVQRVLLVRVGGQRVALPIGKLERILELDASALERSRSECFVLVDDEPLPVIELVERFAVATTGDPALALLVIAELRGERVALRVDRFEGQQEIYLKPVPELLADVKPLAGLTVLGDGSPVFLLDLNHLV